jgi:hypothetical protein
MNKIIPFIALFALSFQTTFAGSNGTAPETNKSQFQFTNVDLTQNSWDFAYMHYNVNDLSTGESLDIPSFLINYEVKDRTGSVVSKGSGLYMNVMDTKLGSEEDYTIVVSTMINGQKVSQSICKKASPKKLAMKVSANGADLETGALASNDLSYTFSRPKFSNRTESENIQIAPSDVSVNIALNTNTYKIDAGANHTKITDQADYQALKNDLKNLTAQGKNVEMTIEPRLIFKGDVYTDNQSFYEVTASGITEVSSLEAVASK